LERKYNGRSSRISQQLQINQPPVKAGKPKGNNMKVLSQKEVDKMHQGETKPKTNCKNCLGWGGWDISVYVQVDSFYSEWQTKWNECLCCDGTGDVDAN